ncbi:MAG: 1-deoxy-D-xylulose-5-phosphate reductoisomerase [Kiritimatiellae bacterium]|nr:1-deoxy-D-xylulose-5-phosphate reductoisomerase [Kiritimatiellia bacterium]
MKRLIILGSTGSIGENALRVASALRDRVQVVGIAARTGGERLAEQAREFGVSHVALADEKAALACKGMFPDGTSLHVGAEGLVDLASLEEADVVLCAVVGTAGLAPVMAAIDAGKDIALATKEVLVAAGEVVTQRAAETGSRLLPVDSEHNAIFQCLGDRAAEQSRADDIRRLILTASGGPFAGRDDVDFDTVGVEEALAHPRWNMGAKISIDSATLMNKGLEVLEGHWLFGVPLDRIDVVVHPQSIVHSFVEFNDGSVLAQLSPPDMRYAIQYALTYPERCDGGLPGLDLPSMGMLTFSEPDALRFPCLALARQAGEAGGTLPAVMNAANEAAVQGFLEGGICFSGIWRTVSAIMDEHDVISAPSLAAIVDADCWARARAIEMIGQ